VCLLEVLINFEACFSVSLTTGAQVFGSLFSCALFFLLPMATLKSLSDSIIRTARAGGVPTDDERWSQRHIQYLIHNYRHEFIWHNAFLRNNFVPEIDPQTVQDMGCVPLCTVDKSECPTLPVGCCIKKAANIPKFVDLPDMQGATYVGTIDKQHPYSNIDRRLLNDRLSLRFGKDTNFWYMIQQSLYVVTRNSELNWINIAGIFEDPTTVCQYTNGGNPCCFDIFTSDYPAPRRMLEDIQQAIIENEIKVFLTTIPDEVNDSAGI